MSWVKIIYTSLIDQVIFTAAKKEYADYILDRLDQAGNISHRLYRRHCVYQNDIYLKDLSQIGRPLERTMIGNVSLAIT